MSFLTLDWLHLQDDNTPDHSELAEDADEIMTLVQEHCEKYGHEWRQVFDGGRPFKFCVRCSDEQSQDKGE